MKIRAVLVGLAVIAFAPTVRADNNAANAAIAQQLFDEAVKLMDKKQYAEACPKLARSNELAPSGGTLLNLGDCYEKNGQTASAWVSFRDAAARAGVAGLKGAQAAAMVRADALAPKLLHLKIILEPGMTTPPGFEIKRDGVPVSRAELNTEVPIDPGPHTIEASAPGYVSSTDEIKLAPGDPAMTAVVHPLVKAPEAPHTAPKEAPPIDSGKSQRLIGMIVAGGGVVIGAVGGYFGLRAFSTNDEALEHCPDGTRCDALGLSLTDTARTEATVSTVLVVVGGAALIAGGVLYLTAGGKTSASARITPRGIVF